MQEQCLPVLPPTVYEEPGTRNIHSFELHREMIAIVELSDADFLGPKCVFIREVVLSNRATCKQHG